MENVYSYEDKLTGSFFELKRLEDQKEIIFDKGLFRCVWSKSCSGYVDKGNYTSDFVKNHAFFCTPYHDKIIQDSNGELYVFSFSHEFLRSCMINSDFYATYPLFLSLDFDNSVFLKKEVSLDFAYLSCKIEDELSNEQPYQEALIKVLFSQLLIHYQRLLIKKEGVLSKIKHSSYNSLVERFYLAVEDNYKTKHKVKEYAELLKMTTTELSNGFRNFPLSPLKLIHQRIFLEAKRLLSYSNLSIKQISYELGFQETSHFYHFFKSHQDMPPNEFRNKLQ